MRISNKQAKFNYQILEKFEAGIVLTGKEVKAIRAGQGNISQSFAKIIDGELFLINANIAVDDRSTRTRKLLLHKNQIITIGMKVKAKKLTLVPLKMYTKGHLVKVQLALAKLKKKYQKKQSLKKKAIEREIEQELKGTK
jgi:SsrA-binding protein